MKKNLSIRSLALSAMFLALGLILPFLTGQIPYIGQMLLPMHIPVIFCGLICSPQYGLLVGLILPPLRYLLFSMPPIFPAGLAMSFELASYGFFAGLLYRKSRHKCILSLYRALAAAMLLGRLVWGAAMAVFSGLSGSAFPFSAFLSGAFFTAIPGIALQLILIPTIMIALKRAKLVEFSNGHVHMKH